MDYSFPLRSTSELVERVTDAPADAPVLHWVLRDDNRQQYEGRVPFGDDPAYLELRWKPDVRGREQVVGLFQLHLARLADAGYVSVGHVNGATDLGHAVDEVRLRFHRGDRGVVYIQVADELPALPVGVVDATLG